MLTCISNCCKESRENVQCVTNPWIKKTQIVHCWVTFPANAPTGCAKNAGKRWQARMPNAQYVAKTFPHGFCNRAASNWQTRKCTNSLYLWCVCKVGASQYYLMIKCSKFPKSCSIIHFRSQVRLQNSSLKVSTHKTYNDSNPGSNEHEGSKFWWKFIH